MARGINKVILVGHLGADPEVRYTPGGAAVANLRVATSESWTDKQTGQRQDKTEWHRVVLFGRLGEISGEYLRKGSQVYLEGRLQTRKWQDQNGQDRYSTDIVCNEMQMLSGRDSGAAPMGGSNQQGGYQQGNQDNYQKAQPQRAPQNNYSQAPPQAQPSDMGMSIDDMDDIPF